MISADLLNLARVLRPGGALGLSEGLSAQLTANLADLLETYAARVGVLEAAVVPPHLQVSMMPRDLAALDGRVISMADVLARQRARVRLVPIEGGAA